MIVKKVNHCKLIVIAVPGDIRVAEKEQVKIKIYQEIPRKVGQLRKSVPMWYQR